ncbi:MAG TPA: zinc-ribbon domain containing protein [Candidatus Polarisedimenticolia bacterium]|nr:zinc-ribbon domain containing protein [Candidatus Polarisedimenticolia bacterium]
MVESDKSIKCRDCGEEFVFTAGEQAFYKERGFQHEPTRCRRCREEKKRQGGGISTLGTASVGGVVSPREFHEAVCSSCGVATQVPFKPTAGKPVYCRDCFQSVRTGRGVGAS